MSIYVDSLCSHGWRLRGHVVRSCHMWTDSDDIEELHQFAISIGLKRIWFQHEEDKLPHYDLTESMRYRAVTKGAIELNRGEAVRLWRDLRAAGCFRKDYYVRRIHQV